MFRGPRSGSKWLAQARSRAVFSVQFVQKVKMMSIRNMGLCGLMALGAVVAHQPASASVVLLAGLADGYSLVTADPSLPLSANLLARAPSCATVRKNFDDITIDRFVCHSFDLSPYTGHIKSARLDFKAKPGEDPLSFNDSVNLYAGVSAVSFSLATLSLSSWTSPAIGDTAFSINNVSTLLNLNTVPFLDVMVQDDTTVDFFKLTLEVPEPSSLILAAVALSGLVGSLRRRKITFE